MARLTTEELKAQLQGQLPQSQVPPPQQSDGGQKSLGGFGRNVASSTGTLLKDTAVGIGNIFNPNKEKNTVVNLGSLLAGGVGKIVPDRFDQGVLGRLNVQEQDFFNPALNFYKERYGGIDNALETAYKDPAGFLADAAGIVTGVGGAFKVASGAANVASKARTATRLSTLGDDAFRIANAIDPVTGLPMAVNRATTPLKKLTDRVLPGRVINEDAIRAADTVGLDTKELPLSFTSDNPATQIFEGVAANTITGGSKVQKFISNAQQNFVKRAQNIASSFSKTGDFQNIGNKIAEGYTAFYDNFIERKNKLYDVAYEKLNAAGNTTFILNKSADFIDKMIESSKRASEISQEISPTVKKLEKISESLRKGVDMKNIQAYIKQLGKEAFGKEIAGEITTDTKKMIYKNLSQEFDNAIREFGEQGNLGISEAFTKADNFFKEAKDILDSGVVNKIRTNIKRGTESLVTGETLLQKTPIEDIKRIMQIADDNLKGDIRASVLSELIAKSLNSEGIFRGTSFSDAIRKIGKDKLSIIFSPEQIKMIDALQIVEQRLTKSKRWISGSPSTPLAKLNLMVSAVFFSPVFFTNLLAGDVLLGTLGSNKTLRNQIAAPQSKINQILNETGITKEINQYQKSLKKFMETASDAEIKAYGARLLEIQRIFIEETQDEQSSQDQTQ